MGKRKGNKAVEVVVPAVQEVVPATEVASDPGTAAPVKYDLGSVSASKLRADYVKAAWEATAKILPATEAEIAALPEFKPELLKGGRVSGYLAYWTKRGFLVKQ